MTPNEQAIVLVGGYHVIAADPRVPRQHHLQRRLRLHALAAERASLCHAACSARWAVVARRHLSSGPRRALRRHRRLQVRAHDVQAPRPWTFIVTILVILLEVRLQALFVRTRRALRPLRLTALRGDSALLGVIVSFPAGRRLILVRVALLVPRDACYSAREPRRRRLRWRRLRQQRR